MEYTDKEFCIEVWGDLACFTRPEFKVERVSYDVITPSAARAIFEAIFWKPAIRWEITKIEVLNPIKWTNIRRNEVGALASPKKTELFIEDYRQQKNSVMLKDVRYRLHARCVFVPVKDRKAAQRVNDPDDNPMKYYKIFERRARNGQCFNQPYLGTRECVAMFKLVDDTNGPLTPAINETKDLGVMLYDLDFTNPKDIGRMFYRPQMVGGVINVPDKQSKEVMR